MKRARRSRAKKSSAEVELTKRTNQMLEGMVVQLKLISAVLDGLKVRPAPAPSTPPQVDGEKRRQKALEVLALTQADAFRAILKQVNEEYDTPGMIK
ncbi:MAG: hypothetical protein JNK82_10300 [Myxococcaceae bacterium]|nr:hypothetical protein [Myxococcaceae bacterium]